MPHSSYDSRRYYVVHDPTISLLILL